MALQNVAGKLVYVVDFDTMPELPIIGAGWEGPYAQALTLAIMTGIITEPGKYGIEIDLANNPDHYDIHKIIED